MNSFTCVAAHDEDRVASCRLDHRNGIVDCGVRDLELAFGKPGALLLRVRGVLQLDLQPVLGVDAALEADEDREILRARKDVHPSGVSGNGRAHRHGERRSQNCPESHVH
jgi:hypothetical protein